MWNLQPTGRNVIIVHEINFYNLGYIYFYISAFAAYLGLDWWVLIIIKTYELKQ